MPFISSLQSCNGHSYNKKLNKGNWFLIHIVHSLCDIITASQPLLEVGIDHQKYSCIFAFFLYNGVYTILFSLLICSYALLFYPSAPDILHISSHLQTGCGQCYKHQPFYSNLKSYLTVMNYCQFCNLNINYFSMC